MQLNSIELISYAHQSNEVTFILDCTLGAALSLDGQTLTVTSGERTVAIYDGYAVCGVEVAGDYVRMTACRKLDEATEAAISGLDANVAALAEADTAINDQIIALTSAFAKEA